MKNLTEYIKEGYEYTHNLSKSEQDWVNSTKSINRNKVQPKNKKQLKQLINYAFKHNIYDLNFIDTSKITDMSLLFSNCMHNFDVSGWDVSNVTNMGCTFYKCNMFTGKGLENWDVSNVTNMSGMFYKCKTFNCDLSKWNVSNVTDMYSMFTTCENFKGKGLEHWNISKVKDMKNIFNDCDKMSIPSWYKE